MEALTYLASLQKVARHHFTSFPRRRAMSGYACNPVFFRWL